MRRAGAAAVVLLVVVMAAPAHARQSCEANPSPACLPTERPSPLPSGGQGPNARRDSAPLPPDQPARLVDRRGADEVAAGADVPTDGASADVEQGALARTGITSSTVVALAGGLLLIGGGLLAATRRRPPP